MESEERISYLETNKLCIDCLDIVVPDGFNFWSMIAEARHNTNSSRDALGISPLAAPPSPRNYPPLFQVTESVSVTIPIPDVPQAKAAWQWLQKERKPFYMDQLHLTKKLTPLAKRTAETDATIASHHGTSFSHRQTPKPAVRSCLGQPTEPVSGGSAKMPGRRSQSKIPVETIDDAILSSCTPLGNSPSLLDRKIEPSSSSHDPSDAPPYPASTASRSRSASSGHSSRDSKDLSQSKTRASSKAVKSGKLVQESTKKKAKTSCSLPTAPATSSVSIPLEQSIIADSHDKKKSQDPLSTADRLNLSSTKFTPSSPTKDAVVSTAGQKSAPHGLNILGQGQEEAIKETPIPGLPPSAALAKNNSTRPKIENVAPYNSLVLSAQLLAKKPSSKPPKASACPTHTRHWSQHSSTHFFTLVTEPDPDVSAFGSRTLLESLESKIDRGKKREKSNREYGTGSDKATAKKDTGAKEKTVDKGMDGRQELAKGKKGAKDEPKKEKTRKEKTEKEKTEKEKTTHQAGRAPSSATRGIALPAKPESSTNPTKEHKLIAKPDSMSKHHNRPVKPHSTKHAKAAGSTETRGFDLRGKHGSGRSRSNNQQESAQSDTKKDNGKTPNHIKHRHGHKEGYRENGAPNQSILEDPRPSTNGTRNSLKPSDKPQDSEGKNNNQGEKPQEPEGKNNNHGEKPQEPEGNNNNQSEKPQEPNNQGGKPQEPEGKNNNQSEKPQEPNNQGRKPQEPEGNNNNQSEKPQEPNNQGGKPQELEGKNNNHGEKPQDQEGNNNNHGERPQDPNNQGREAPRAREVSSQAEKPQDREVSSQAEKPQDPEVSSQGEKPQDPKVSIQGEKPQDPERYNSNQSKESKDLDGNNSSQGEKPKDPEGYDSDQSEGSKDPEVSSQGEKPQDPKVSIQGEKPQDPERYNSNQNKGSKDPEGYNSDQSEESKDLDGNNSSQGEKPKDPEGYNSDQSEGSKDPEGYNSDQSEGSKDRDGNYSDQSNEVSSSVSTGPDNEAEPLENEGRRLSPYIIRRQLSLLAAKSGYKSHRRSSSRFSHSSRSSNGSTQPPGQGDFDMAYDNGRTSLQSSSQRLSSKIHGWGSKSRRSSSSEASDDASSDGANDENDASSDDEGNDSDSGSDSDNDNGITDKEDKKSDEESDEDIISNDSQPDVDETSGSESHNGSDDSDGGNDSDMGSDGDSLHRDMSSNYNDEDGGDNSDIDWSNSGQDSDYDSDSGRNY
ncbi:herpesvirus latent membrane protein-like [Metarhizium robertsii]|uniref:Herpesvirus latent membrane protein-like n=1 Tax=Metarhizium robertsii TaxID=568076 RepID=A0A0A1V0V1_9HYPO|nr:herpesvirus latent membrane protein-like [Metarhizium robertsii]